MGPMRRLLGILSLPLAVPVGCALLGAGPVSAPNFPDLVRQAVPPEDGDVLLFGPGRWFPNAGGFKHAYSGRVEAQIAGVLVIAENAILVQQWDETRGRLEPLKRFPLASATAVTLASFGLNRRLVVRWQDVSVDSFAFQQLNGAFLDNAKTEQAVDLMRSNLRERRKEPAE